LGDDDDNDPVEESAVPNPLDAMFETAAAAEAPAVAPATLSSDSEDDSPKKRHTREFSPGEKMAALFRHAVQLKLMSVTTMLQSEMCDDVLLQVCFLHILMHNSTYIFF
jgi:hypothetical protein